MKKYSIAVFLLAAIIFVSAFSTYIANSQQEAAAISGTTYTPVTAQKVAAQGSVTPVAATATTGLSGDCPSGAGFSQMTGSACSVSQVTKPYTDIQTGYMPQVNRCLAIWEACTGTADKHFLDCRIRLHGTAEERQQQYSDCVQARLVEKNQCGITLSACLAPLFP